MPTTTVSTTLLESVNIVLANLGESPVNTLSGNALPQQVSLALNTIEEVSTDIQSKGWWFNQQTSSAYDTTANVVIYPSNTANEWSSSIPEEARRYITIRSSRIAQTRLIGSEELQKFSYNEELVSLAILQQAHVRNSGGVLDFNDFPAELRGLGMDEVMFLQGNVEEKIGTLRLGGELATIAKTKAETALIADQEELVTKQALTEVNNALKVIAETSLLNDQEALVVKQALTEVAKEIDIRADTAIKGKQGALIDNQAATELKNALKVVAETSLINDQEALVANQAATELKKALDLVADTTIKGKQGSLIDNQAATELKNALKAVAETSLINDQEALVVKQALTEVAKATDLGADTAIKGKQGTLIDNQAATELKTALKLVADTTLVGKQGSLVDAQATTEASQQAVLGAQATNIGADTTLKGAQATTEASQQTVLGAQATNIGADTSLKGAQATTEASQSALLDAQELKTDEETKLITAQELKTDAESALVANQSSLVVSQKTQLDAQTAIEATAEKAFFDAGGVDIGGSIKTYRDFAAEMRMMGFQETQFQGTPAYKKIELIKDANKLRTATTTTETGTDATELLEVNKVMRFIGEPPASALNSNSLASECVRLLRDTDTELQGRGWWFNTEEDVVFTPENGVINPTSDVLSLEADDHVSRIKVYPSGIRRLYDLKEKSDTSWSSEIKAKVIYQRDLTDTPSKYREYLNVRVAILLTELYPQSGVDIQRLPKMELELRAYFKDREFDDANYSVFDNYDAASRIGINRNYDLT